MHAFTHNFLNLGHITNIFVYFAFLLYILYCIILYIRDYEKNENYTHGTVSFYINHIYKMQ
jgi:hypothetical protein